MPNDLQAQLAAVKKNAILDAAIQTFANYGYQKATIKLIAKEAGMADGTIYNYFKNKEAILLGILERLTQAEAEELESAQLAELPFSAFIQTFVADRMHEANADYNSYKALIPENITNAAVREAAYAQLYAPGFKIAEQYIEGLMKDGRLAAADPQIMARLFPSAIFGILLMRLMGDEHIAQNWDAYTQAVIDMIVRAFPDQQT